ncbi:hypothetical protein NDU88_005685 [Pleurodeles waltl]|uniref:Uncharacterized protein n=1 Tax=Pleurodeles waltl TaxID=8319 RepID=A0AAV7RKD1_PLEWA|nr:hypothetical protein NDU88_005685 [Pleurodeles waltl]
METQTPDWGTTGRCWLWLGERAGEGANWPSRPDRGSSTAARPHRTDHGAGGWGRGRELVQCGSRMARHAKPLLLHRVVLCILLVSASGALELLLSQGKGRSFFLPLWTHEENHHCILIEHLFPGQSC